MTILDSKGKLKIRFLGVMGLWSLSATHCFAGFYEDRSEGFFDKKAEGWFWYAPDEEEQTQTITRPKPQPPQHKPIEPKQQAKKEEPLAPAVEPMTAEWFRKNIPKYRDEAWNNPTVENVKAFYYVQRMAIDRSNQFSDVAQRAVLGDPYLDEQARRPTSSFASKAMDRAANEAGKELLTQIAQKAGFFFFFKANCEACNLQGQVLKMLEQSVGFHVIPISMDGQPLSSGEFTEFKKDNGQSTALKVTNAPAIYLATPDGKFAPIGFNAMSFEDVSYRTMLAALSMDLISEQDFNKTRPVNTERDLSSSLQHLDESLGTNNPVENKTNYIPPTQLLEAIKQTLDGNH